MPSISLRKLVQVAMPQKVRPKYRIGRLFRSVITIIVYRWHMTSKRTLVKIAIAVLPVDGKDWPLFS